MEQAQTILETVASFAEAVQDVTEETFLLFSQNIPSNNLGILDDKASTVFVEVAGRDYEIRQSSGLLTSSRNGGTTGAVLWKVTPLLCDWIVSSQNCLWKYGVLSPQSTVVELGCGVAGLVGLSLENLVSRYVLTDQDYVMKLLRENIKINHGPARGHGAAKSGRHRQQIGSQISDRLCLVKLDWETDSVQTLTQILDPGEQIDMLLLCDCVYNDYLVQPLVQICIEVCELHRTRQTLLMIAQQLRTDEVFQNWMESLSKSFMVWRVSDKHLPDDLKSSSGYVIHLAMLKPKGR